LKALIKVQYVDSISKNPKAAKLIVGKRLAHVDKRDLFDHVVEMLDLEPVLEREVG